MNDIYKKKITYSYEFRITKIIINSSLFRKLNFGTASDINGEIYIRNTLQLNLDLVFFKYMEKFYGGSTMD